MSFGFRCDLTAIIPSHDAQSRNVWPSISHRNGTESASYLRSIDQTSSLTYPGRPLFREPVTGIFRTYVLVFQCFGRVTPRRETSFLPHMALNLASALPILVSSA